MEEFLPSVVDYSPAELAEVIVADNGSTDASVDMLKEKFPSVRIIQLDKNYGFAEGYNQALKQIDNEYTVLLNSDVEVTPGWLDAPLAAMEADSTIVAAQPKIRAQRNKDYFEYAGAAGRLYGYLRIPLLPGTPVACCRKRRRPVRHTCRYPLGYRSLSVYPYHYLQGMLAGTRCRLLRPPGRDRYVLAAAFAGVSPDMYPPVGRLHVGGATCR